MGSSLRLVQDALLDHYARTILLPALEQHLDGLASSKQLNRVLALIPGDISPILVFRALSPWSCGVNAAYSPEILVSLEGLIHPGWRIRRGERGSWEVAGARIAYGA